MSYPLDLDEMPSKAMREELIRRRTDQQAGRCDYCHRSIETPPCKFPDRHAAKTPRIPLLKRFMLFLRAENRKPGVMADHEMDIVMKRFRTVEKSGLTVEHSSPQTYSSHEPQP